MKPPKLSSRLQMLADLAAPCRRLVDIGCDHALLGIYLLFSGGAESAYLTDIHEGPCEKAQAALCRYGMEERAVLRCCDGLGGALLHDGDALVIAGMGGHEIVSILRPVSIPAGCRMILQPLWNREILRRYLAEEGFTLQERICDDKGRLYSVFLPEKGGEKRSLTLLEASLGTRFAALPEGKDSLSGLDWRWLENLAFLYERKSRKYPEYREVGQFLQNLCAGKRPSI